MDTILNCQIYSFSNDTLGEDKRDFFTNSGLVFDQNDGEKFDDLLSKIPLPFSIVLDPYYVDKVYRDSYYRYFSSKHSNTERNCKRVAFFAGDIDYKDFFCVEGREKLQANFLGFSVIRPINPGAVGRTLLDPKRLNIDSGYVRTTTFDTVLLGVKLKVNAFPFSSQDTEIMTCAETSVWNIFEYYGTRYPDYKIIYPSDIVDCLSKSSSERTLPSEGLRFTQISTVLKEFGFSPRIYFKESGYPDNDFKRMFHYYVESGIPLVVGIEGIQNNHNVGHAVVCIGHGEKSSQPNVVERNGLFYIDSADFYSNYFIMDDNQIPYVLANYNQITPNLASPKVSGFVVPLYKRILFDASGAASFMYLILSNSNVGVLGALNAYDGEGKYSRDNPLVVRIFLTTARSFKGYRSLNHGNEKLAHLYSNIPLPKFIWVAELSTKDLFMQGKVFGEIIVDATATKLTYEKLIAVHYPGFLGYRLPSESESIIFDRMRNPYSKELATTYPLYINNLS